MVFSSITFLIAFLPCAIIAERLMPTIASKNAVLILASLVFYAYGEPVYVLLLLASTVVNYVLGLLCAPERSFARAWLVVAIAVNLSMLVVFKYANMIVSTIDALLEIDFDVPEIPLPLGISFYTFQALSYVIDVYRGDVKPQKNYARVLLYISFFPQLVAGPIVKYHDFGHQMERRQVSLADRALGLRRFCLGLAKKVLLANVVAGCADALFGLPAETLCAPGAWVAAFAYLLQIYLDFSAYSDMAIGLARCFGFTLQENFEHPYSSVSVREFWRRWHISLSTWFREYLYIPLGGNRKGPSRAALNRAIVFFCCGLWHGANWTFVVWGLLHGAALLVEQYHDTSRLPRIAGHALTLLFVMLTFVVFRCDTLVQALTHIAKMLIGWNITRAQLIPVLAELNPRFIACACVGVAISGSLPRRVRDIVRKSKRRETLDIAGFVCAFILLILSMASLAGGTYNPFIYFRF